MLNICCKFARFPANGRQLTSRVLNFPFEVRGGFSRQPRAGKRALKGFLVELGEGDTSSLQQAALALEKGHAAAIAAEASKEELSQLLSSRAECAESIILARIAYQTVSSW